MASSDVIISEQSITYAPVVKARIAGKNDFANSIIDTLAGLAKRGQVLGETREKNRAVYVPRTSIPPNLPILAFLAPELQNSGHESNRKTGRFRIRGLLGYGKKAIAPPIFSLHCSSPGQRTVNSIWFLEPREDHRRPSSKLRLRLLSYEGNAFFRSFQE